MRKSKLTWRKAEQLITEYTEEISSPDLVGDPLVSVCFHTYNHAQFIIEALDSVLMQEADFPFEILIGDDASTDGTSEIIDRYQREHPDRIKILRSTENLGKYTGNGRLNFIRGLRACRGKYIAMFEGDDYWTDPLKLQKQVDFLETHPDFSVCFHNALLKKTRGGKRLERKMHESLGKDVFGTEDLLGEWFIPTASIVLKKYHFDFPEWFLHCDSGDLALLLLSSLTGKLKYLDEVMSVYRLHDNGISTLYVGHRKVIGAVFLYQNFNIHTNYQFNEKITEAIIHDLDTHLPEIRVLKNRLRAAEVSLSSIRESRSFAVSRRLSHLAQWPFRIKNRWLTKKRLNE